MNKANTLIGIDFSSKRRDGNSTRQIDHAIQLLFKGFKVEIRDHHESVDSNKLLYQRVLKRFHSEYKEIAYTLMTNPRKLEIWLDIKHNIDNTRTYPYYTDEMTEK